MSRAWNEKVESLFEYARHLSADEARQWLRDVCGEDDALRHEVEGLLEAHAPGLLESPEHVPPQGRATLPKTIGPYTILGLLGQGGMGAVYLAEQSEPIRRRVAIKVIRAGLDSEQVLARFETERQALASMTHPNVAKVLDAGGTDDGQPYFVMEYVEGLPITKFCDARRCTIRERLELMLQVCDGVEHAHRQGFIHRDLKPSNVLVALCDDTPRATIIDFGVAKTIAGPIRDEADLTNAGQLVGTPRYMSPEQAGATDPGIDHRSDVYALGTLLYRLLVGAHPVAADRRSQADVDEYARRIATADVPAPSERLQGLEEAGFEVACNRSTDLAALREELKGDLDRVVLRALEKDRRLRYGSTKQLRADIVGFLDRNTSLAAPTPRASRWSWAAAALLAVVGLALASVMVLDRRQSEAEAPDHLVGYLHSVNGHVRAIRDLLGQHADELPAEERQGLAETFDTLVESLDREIMGTADDDFRQSFLDDLEGLRRRIERSVVSSRARDRLRAETSKRQASDAQAPARSPDSPQPLAHRAGVTRLRESDSSRSDGAAVSGVVGGTSASYFAGVPVTENRQALDCVPDSPETVAHAFNGPALPREITALSPAVLESVEWGAHKGTKPTVAVLLTEAAQGSSCLSVSELELALTETGHLELGQWETTDLRVVVIPYCEGRRGNLVGIEWQLLNAEGDTTGGGRFPRADSEVSHADRDSLARAVKNVLAHQTVAHAEGFPRDVQVLEVRHQRVVVAVEDHPYTTGDILLARVPGGRLRLAIVGVDGDRVELASPCAERLDIDEILAGQTLRLHEALIFGKLESFAQYSPTRAGRLTPIGGWGDEAGWAEAVSSASTSGYVSEVVQALDTAQESASDYLAYAVTEADRVPLPADLEPILQSDPQWLLHLEWGEYAWGKIPVVLGKAENESSRDSYRIETNLAIRAGDLVAQQPVPLDVIEIMLANSLAQTGRFEVDPQLPLRRYLRKSSPLNSYGMSRARIVLHAVVNAYDPGNSESSVTLTLALRDPDTSTTKIVKNVRARIGQATSLPNCEIPGASGGLAGLVDEYCRSSIGQAVLAAIHTATYELIKHVGNQPISGAIDHVDGTRLRIGVGNDRTRVGERFTILGDGQQVPLPAAERSAVDLVGDVALVTEVDRVSSYVKLLGDPESPVTMGRVAVSPRRPPELRFGPPW